jgi:antitoxin component YwqK of YwqJK toxin-antitoxin module
MKLFYSLIFCICFFINGSVAQNLISNAGFEDAEDTFTVAESTTKVLRRVRTLVYPYDFTETTQPASTIISVTNGMWVKKAGATDNAKAVINSDFHSGTKGLNLKILAGTTFYGFNNWCNSVVQQKVSLQNTKKYIVSFWAKVDATANNKCTEITVFALNKTMDSHSINNTIVLTGGKTWTKYTTILDVPTFVSLNPTANFSTSYFGVGISTTYNTLYKTNYSGVVLDDFSLTKDTLSGTELILNENKAFTLVKNGFMSNFKGMIQVYSFDGKILRNSTISNGDIVTLSAGVYIVRLTTKNGFYIQKMAF